MRLGMMIVGASAAVVLAGCELGPPMTPAECAGADWRVIGYTDGTDGVGSDHFGERAQACANAGYSADQSAYGEGYREGVRLFCRPERGFRLGESGDSPQVTCPEDMARDFDAAWRDGRDLYQAKSEFESAESAIRSLWSERDDVLRKLQANELGLAQSVTEADKSRHRSEVIRLRDELYRVERRTREAEYDARWKRDAYERLRFRMRW